MTLPKDTEDRVTNRYSQLNKNSVTEPLQTQDASPAEYSVMDNCLDVSHRDIIANPVDIYKFIHPDKTDSMTSAIVSCPEDQSDINTLDNNSGILEAAFSSIISTEIPVELKPQQIPSTPAEPLIAFNSADDIKQIHQQGIKARADAFHQLIQLKNNDSVTEAGQTHLSDCFADIDLALEFSRIKDNDKVDVFIEEFEQLIVSLNSQKPAIEKTDNIDYLIQFKTSIHMIKLLSGMMQAGHLNQFSQTVIEFLDDLLDDKSSLTSDIIKRLSVVVNCYGRYNDCIKDRS